MKVIYSQLSPLFFNHNGSKGYDVYVFFQSFFKFPRVKCYIPLGIVILTAHVRYDQICAQKWL